MTEYFVKNSFMSDKEKYEVHLLNKYANLYMMYDNNENHMYHHIENNLMDVMSAEELKKRIANLKEHLISCGAKESDLV